MNIAAERAIQLHEEGKRDGSSWTYYRTQNNSIVRSTALNLTEI
jgi:hypothetical protein